jgi:SRSO17 transposase
VWNDHPCVADELGDPDGVLRCEETGFIKKGHDSVGVARQYCGTLGKGANGQVGVCAASASRRGDALVDQRVFLPEAWCADTSATRRTKCQGPTELPFQSKPQLAAAMLQAIAHAGLLPFKYVVADGLYGPSPDFLEAVDAWVGVTTCVAMPADPRCWLPAPRPQEHVYRSKGAVRSTRVVAPDTAPCPVATVAARRPASRWSQRQGSEGTQGPIVYAVARQRVTLCKDGVPERTVWLVIQRPLGAEPSYSDSLSNAPARPPLRPLVWRSGLRWAIEHCCEAGKTELGMDHYEGCKYPGWHHHMLTTMVAHFFLWHLKRHWGEKSPSPHRVAPADGIGGGPPSTEVYD